jgi:hypothetical protein
MVSSVEHRDGNKDFPAEALARAFGTACLFGAGQDNLP